MSDLPPAFPDSPDAAIPGGPPALTLDPRRNVFRPDLAAQCLYGRVAAPRYASGIVHQVARASLPLRKVPHVSAGFETEALFGEIVSIYDVTEGWAWIQLHRDHYVGYVPADALVSDVREITHRVKANGTFVYPEPDIKAPPLMHLSLNAGLSVIQADDRFCQLHSGGFVFRRHVTEHDRYAKDFVEIAERLIGTPYLWGGRTRVGIDCSGLVQIALEAAGIACPRDSDMQQAEVGAESLPPGSLDHLRRGDLVFWKGHVGIMIDGITLLHANAHHMSAAVETLPEVVARIARLGSDVTAIKRLSALGA